ncbi:uncharacterized protein V6R79_020535 [Siganus canaliculatus]
MAFDGHQSTVAYSLFPRYQRQEQDTAPYAPWSHNGHDEPCGLISGAQSSTKCRKPTDNADFDGETDLQGLVSNILDEPDSQDGYYSEGRIPMLNPVWSPKALREELLQYFQSDTKTQQNPSFPANSSEALSKAQRQSVNKDSCQPSNGFATSYQWPFNLPNRNEDGFCPQRLPPGLPVSNPGNAYLSHIPQNKHENMGSNIHRGSSLSLTDFADLSDVVKPQNETNSQFFHPHYEDHYLQRSVKPISSEQHTPQDINQLVSSFQSFMVGQRDHLDCEDFPNMYREAMGLHHEDTPVAPWNMTNAAMSTQSAASKPLEGKYGPIQVERKAPTPAFKGDAFQDFPCFNPQNTDYFQQPKSFPGSFHILNQYPSKMTMHRENASLPNNVSMSQYLRHQVQQDELQSKFKPQMQKEKKRMLSSGFLGEGLSARPPNNFNRRAGGKKQVFSQNPYLDHLGSVLSQRFDGENSVVNAGNVEQLRPLVYPVNDLRRHCSMPVNSPNLGSRSTLPLGSAFPGMEMADMLSASESAAFSAFFSDMSNRGAGPYPSIAQPVMTTSLVMNEGGLVNQLYFLDECYEQCRCLEKERKKTEVILTRAFAGSKITAAINANLPKTPPNPTRVDHLLVNQLREQTRVGRLMESMEYLRNVSLHINIHTALNNHRLAISITQDRHKDEMANVSKHQPHTTYFTEDRDALFLASALKNLTATTRKLRTALWCALQITLPPPVRSLDNHVNRDAACTPAFEE